MSVFVAFWVSKTNREFRCKLPAVHSSPVSLRYSPAWPCCTTVSCTYVSIYDGLDYSLRWSKYLFTRFYMTDSSS